MNLIYSPPEPIVSSRLRIFDTSVRASSACPLDVASTGSKRKRDSDVEQHSDTCEIVTHIAAYQWNAAWITSDAPSHS